VFVGPQVRARLGFDKLRGDSKTAAGFAHATLQHVAHPKFPSDLPHVHCLALKDEARIAGDDEQPF
jgi:hypothetical protein